MRRIGQFLPYIVFLMPASAWAQEELNLREPPPPNISSEFLDPSGVSRFHLITRGTFSDNQRVFAHNSGWGFEADAHIRIQEGLALYITFPVGLVTARGSPNQVFIGNVSAGLEGGTHFLLNRDHADTPDAAQMGLGAALEFYAPSAPKPASSDVNLLSAELGLASMRAYNPWLYLSNQVSARGRLQANLSSSILALAIEGGLIPALTLDAHTHFLLWASFGGRLVVRASATIEPFVELATSIQVQGPGPTLPGFNATPFSPAALLSPGLRFHLGEFDPAVFVSISLKNSAQMLFAIDLAGAQRGGNQESHDDVFREFGR